MHELIINLHIHTTYSDGHFTHAQIAKAAIQAGLDGIIVTDHNVYVHNLQRYYESNGRRVLLLIGEEIHNQSRQPQKNHLLVFGANRELSPYANDPQELLDTVRQAGGLAFLAHPYDPAAPAVNERDISWVDWQVKGYTGIELWNGFSEFKSRLKTRLHAIFLAYQPQRIARGPLPQTIKRWDELLTSGEKVVVIGGSDAHALPAKMGPLKRTIFPYEFHFRCINTHILTRQALSGEAQEDARLVLDALKEGRGFIGYDLPAPTRGFRFTARSDAGEAWMGETLALRKGATLQVRLPNIAECQLIKDGKTIKTWHNRDICTCITKDPGVYRVEVYKNFLGARRCWIFSNPIYLKGE